MHKFNQLIKNRKTKMFNFPGASSHQLLHYLDVHLKDKSIDTAIIHIGIIVIRNGKVVWKHGPHVAKF